MCVLFAYILAYILKMLFLFSFPASIEAGDWAQW